MSTRVLTLTSLTLALAIAGCHSPATGPLGSATTPTRPATSAGAGLLPLPTAHAAYTATAGGRDAIGTVGFASIANPAFADSAAPYRVAAMTLAHALVTLSTLEESVYTRPDGSPIIGASDASGHFALAGSAPTDRPFVVNAGLAGGYRLSAIALATPAASGTLTVDEASTMVAETARWQIRSQAEAPGQRSLNDLTATTLAALVDASRRLAPQLPLLATGPNGPTLDPLRQGAGFVLRNAYVRAFGSAVDANGSSDADALSDGWKALLGTRPLALTRLAGTGGYGNGSGDDTSANTVALAQAADATSDPAGNVFLCENASNLVRVVPAAARAGFGAYPGAMTAGSLYSVLGNPNTSLASNDQFNQAYAASETLAVSDATAAPAIASGGTPFPIFAPRRVLPVPTAAGTDLYVASDYGHRVLFVPAQDITGRFGRNFKANRLYTLAGGANASPAGTAPTAYDGQAATQATWAAPTGLARDSRGNLYILDRGSNGASGSLRLVRASDGKTYALTPRLGASPIALEGARDLALVEGAGGASLYVANTGGHYVFRMALPALASLDTSVPASLSAQIVLGQPNKPGFLDIGQPGVSYPAAQDLAAGVPQAQVLLNQPTSLCFDRDGNLIVADLGRVRLLQAAGLGGSNGLVYTLAGGLVTSFLEGDARLATLPATERVSLDAATGDLLVTDGQSNLVRRLWTRRGSY